MSVLGTGYLGATHAACMAELGHEVLGVDIDPNKIVKLAAGEAPFFEPGLDDGRSSGAERHSERTAAAFVEEELRRPGRRHAGPIPRRRRRR